MARGSDGTVTAAENEVLAILRDGPCETAGHTEVGPRYRLVDLTVCRRLVKAGLVVIDRGGVASLVEK